MEEWKSGKVECWMNGTPIAINDFLLIVDFCVMIANNLFYKYLYYNIL